MPEDISAVFVTHAASILAHTSFGLSGNEIVQLTAAYAIDWNVNLPHPMYPFGMINKRTALSENLMAFSSQQRYQIIRDLCDHKTLQAQNKTEADKLKIQLFIKYGHFDDGGSSDLNQSLVEETRHWLATYPNSLQIYTAALRKYEHKVFRRNVLDDLRLSLEKLLQELLENNRSLENQMPSLGNFIKIRGGSSELANMFFKLVDYYTKYQNTYVKHDDAVIEEEVEFVLEITSSFMKHLTRIQNRIKLEAY